MDPLCIYSPAVNLLEGGRDAEATVQVPELWDPLFLVLAPDAYHKSNTSGGEPYGIHLPFSGVDPMLSNEPHNLPFLEYLRLCVRLGGFPGLESLKHRSDVQGFITDLTKGIPEF